MAELTTNYQVIGETYYGVNGGAYTLLLYAKYNSQSVSGNKTNITISLRTRNRDGYSSFWSSENSSGLTCGWDRGTQYYNIGSVGSSEVWIGTWTFDIGHDASGYGSASASAWADVYAGVIPGVSGSFTLPRIARNFTRTPEITVSKNNETSFNCSWITSETCSKIRYSYNNGSTWTQLGNFTEGTSGTFSLSSLTADTTYNIKFEFTRKDSSLTTEVSAQQTTYSYPYLSAATPTAGSVWNMSGSSQTMGGTIYNPLGRSVKAYVSIGTTSGTKVVTFTTTTTASDAVAVSASLTKATINGNITTAQSATLVYWCEYSTDGTNYTTSSKTLTNTYQLRETDCKPTISNFTYTDGNNTTKNVMNDGGQTIVQNYGIVKATVGTATYQYGATFKSMSITLGSKTVAATVGTAVELGVFNYSTNQTMTATITDSRGWTHTITKTVTFIGYVAPIVNVEAERTNGYGTNATFTVSASYTSLGGKNAWLNNNSAYVRYSISPTPSTPAATGNVSNTNPITSQTINITGADNDLTYTITIYANDKITSATATATFGQGQPILSVMKDCRGVGINTVPTVHDEPGLYVKDYLKVTGSEYVAGTLTATGDITTNSGISANDGITTYGRIRTTDTSAMSINTTGGIQANGNAVIGGNTSITGSLSVGGKTLLDLVYPVGSIYISVNSTNPGTLFGGTWTAFATGKTLVGIDSNDEDFDTIENTGGAKTHTLSVQELPKHKHNIYERIMVWDAGKIQNNGNVNWSGAQQNFNYNECYTNDTGGDQPHNNLQPYIVVHMWKRTA